MSSGNLAEPYERQITLGIVTSCLSLLVFLISAVSSPWQQWIPALSVLGRGLNVTTQLLLTGVTSFFLMLAMLWTWDSPRASIFLREDINIALALLTGGLLYLNLGLIFSLALALILFVLIVQRIESGLILTLLWAPFFLFPVSLHTYSFPMVEVMILITGAAGAVRFMVYLGHQLRMENGEFSLISKAALLRVNAIDLAVLSLVLLGAASLLWTEALNPARTELRTMILEPALFYVLMRSLRPSRHTLKHMFAALIIAGVLVSLYGLYNYFVADAIITAEGETRRLLSVYGSPNNVGLLLGRTIPIALALLLVRVEKRMRWLAAISLLLMVPVLFLTQSVGAIIFGVPAGTAIVLLARYRRRAVLPIFALGGLGVAGIALLTRVSTRFASLLDFASGTNFIRLRLWESAIAMIREHPLTGLGLDQFFQAYGGQYLRPDAIWDRDLSHPHNFILDFWTRLSIFGVLAFLVIQLVFWRASITLCRRFRQSDALLFALTLGLMGSMAGLLAHGLIDNSVFVIDLAFIFMFQLAALMRLRELAADSSERQAT